MILDAISMIIGLIGGLGLFLFGMKLMGDGLENAAGEGLKNILEKVTSNPIMGVLIGAIVTAVIQSSSATTVMVVGFVNAGLMNLSQAVGVIMGANIGTTITGQLVAFKLDHIAPIFVGVGSAIVLFSKSNKRREFGNIVLGFGILFMGMGIMGDSMKPISDAPQFQNLVVAIGDNWLIGLIVGLAMTAIVQSSSATTGILIALASTGSIDMNVALPIILGCNIGTCVTALLSSIGTSKTARKAAIIHLFFNVLGTLIFIPLRGVLVHMVQYISPMDVKRQIANAHTIFNITNTLVLLPLSKYLIIAANKLIPGEDQVEKIGATFIDERFLETPVIALGQVIKEVSRMANKAKENLEISMGAFRENDDQLVSKVYENEKIINALEEDITTYLVKLSKTELSDEQKGIIASTFHVVNDIERIGDHAENIADLTSEKIIKRLEYTAQGMGELKQMYDYTLHALEVAIESYKIHDPKRIEEVSAIEQRIDELEKEFREAHISRLNSGVCSPNAGAVFLDIISNLERIGDHAKNIAENVTNTFA
ncbi:Na/Pi cotransporter family protein [Clostridium amazonitimonense]|uniref:Na/Pi cotransporter family protein n=1 Tax=Clostridium amazonitimonense TaxID=1499689 RepID=UPI001FAB2AC5|nr:Na/Pi cotransporter family protein [Clostridium amazonitimonense]